MPSKDSVPKKKPVYGDKRKKKPNAPTPEGTALLLLVSPPLKKHQLQSHLSVPPRNLRGDVTDVGDSRASCHGDRG